MVKTFKIALLLMALCLVLPVEAKKYKYDINEQRNVVVKRSGGPGRKVVEVVAVAGSVDKAIRKALVDAAVAMTFEGAGGSGEMEACPPIMQGGRTAYDENKKFFDDFFTEGVFLQYVHRVSNEYPSGSDNVKVKGGNQVRIVLVVDWQQMAGFFNSKGFKTNISNLQNF